MFRKLKPFLKTNKFVLESYRKYVTFSSRSEKIFDIIFPIILSLTFVGLSFLLNNPTIGIFLEKIESLNSSIITAISILAGFNFAGISVISSSQSELVSYLKQKKSKHDGNSSLFTVLMIFFTWSIVVQLVVVCIGIFIYFSSHFFVPTSLDLEGVPLWMWLIIASWLSLVLHSLFLSIRNIKMLFLFITKDISELEIRGNESK